MKTKLHGQYQAILHGDFEKRVVSILWMLAAAFSLFSFLNYTAGNAVMFIADFCRASFLILLGLVIRQGIFSHQSAFVMLWLVFFCSVLYVYTFPHGYHGILYYYTVLPFFVLYLLGSNIGMRYNIIVFAGIWLVYIAALFADFEVSYSLSETVMFTVLFAFVSYFALVFERMREQKFIDSYHQGLRRESLLNAIDAVYYRADMAGLMLEVSPAICAMSGYSVDELVGKPILDYYAYPAEREAYIEKLKTEGRVKNYTVSLMKKNADLLVISMSSHIVFSDDGEPQYVEGVFLDITQEQRIARERQESLDHLSNLSFIEMALSVPDFEQSLQRSVEETRRIYGACRAFLVPLCEDTVSTCGQCHGEVFVAYKDDETGFFPRQFVQDDDVRIALRDTDTDTDTDTEFCPIVINESSFFPTQVIEKYGIKSHIMIVIHVSSGARWLLSVQYCAQTTPCTAQQKRLLMDISHRLRSAIGQLTLQKDLEQTVQRVEMASQAKGDFLATMSHELRTPLHGVIGLLALLDTERERLSLDQQTNLLLAQSSAHVLSSLIDDVLDLSKIEAGKVELQDKAFDVEKTLRSALVPFVMKAREKDLELQLELQNVAKTLIGDELRLRQVLLNLVGNALKFTQQGFVRITTWQAQGQWHITIEDSGIGIAVEKQESLFNPFVQVHDMEVLGENLQEKGTGLGTTIAKHFVEMMGGSISVKSELGKGAIFHIHLPLREADAERTSLCLTTHDLVVQRKKQRVDVSGVQGAAHKLSVLVAEDDPIGRKIAEKQLKRAGFSVIAVADGLQALAQVKEKPFDLLLTDVRMPGMNGMELAKMVRQYEEETGKKRMFIMGLSAHALEEVKNEALAHGMDDFISKPVDMQALMEKLERSGSEAVVEDA